MQSTFSIRRIKKKKKERLHANQSATMREIGFFFISIPEQSSDDRTSQCIHPDMGKGNKVK